MAIPQALWVAARATRLPEAEGPRSGRDGAGPALRLLILGDSSAAGVGVAHQSQALAGCLVADLARDHAVTWQVTARSGATVRDAAGLARGLAPRAFDVVLLALGVNDVKNGVPRRRFVRDYTALIAHLQTGLEVPHVIATGVPPVGAFPILPRPLSDVLGARAAQFDLCLADLTRAAGATHLPFDIPYDPALMAADGFHPGPGLYAEWAARAAAAIRLRLGREGP